MSDRIRKLEFERGKADAEAGHPPVTLASPYVDGYVQGGGWVPPPLRTG